MNFNDLIRRTTPPSKQQQEAAELGDDAPDLAKDGEDTVHEFTANMKREKQGMALANDSEYWCALVFETREQKEAFLEAMKLAKLGDKYINGLAAARIMGIKLPPSPVFRGLKQASGKLAKLR